MRSVMSLFRFGIDLDGVLNDLGETMLSLWKRDGVVDPAFTVDKVNVYEFENCVPGITGEMVYQALMDGECFREANSLKDALYTLDMLKDAGAEIHVVTARGLSSAHRLWTQEWLHEQRVAYDKLAFVSKKYKLEYATDNHLDFFIEDHWPTAFAMADVCRMSILLDRPYNQEPIPGECTTMRRMFSWKEIRHYFVGKWA